MVLTTTILREAGTMEARCVSGLSRLPREQHLMNTSNHCTEEAPISPRQRRKTKLREVTRCPKGHSKKSSPHLPALPTPYLEVTGPRAAASSPGLKGTASVDWTSVKGLLRKRVLPPPSTPSTLPHPLTATDL